MNPKVDQYLLDGCGRCEFYATEKCKVHSWQPELIELRRILLDSDLTEDLKWSFPCYTFEGRNILMLSALKEYCSLGFFKGALLSDRQKLLTAPGENSQAVRQFRFTGLEEILKSEQSIKEYVVEAIQIEKSGKKIDFKAKHELDYPLELEQALDADQIFEDAFNLLTPGRKRAWVLFFSAPKQTATRASRIEKSKEKIMLGKGPNDR